MSLCFNQLRTFVGHSAGNRLRWPRPRTVGPGHGRRRRRRLWGTFARVRAHGRYTIRHGYASASLLARGGPSRCCLLARGAPSRCCLLARGGPSRCCLLAKGAALLSSCEGCPLALLSSCEGCPLALLSLAKPPRAAVFLRRVPPRAPRLKAPSTRTRKKSCAIIAALGEICGLGARTHGDVRFAHDHVPLVSKSILGSTRV